MRHCLFGKMYGPLPNSVIILAHLGPIVCEASVSVISHKLHET